MQAQTKQQIENLIQFAFAERRFKNVIQLIDKYITLFQQDKNIHIKKAKAYLQLNNPQETIKCIEKAQQKGASIQQIGFIKTRAFLEIGMAQQSQSIFDNLLNSNSEYKQILSLKNAIQIIKDKDGRHKLTKEEQQILDDMKKWLYKSGALYDKLKVINMSEGYRGVIATRNIKKKQPIVYIPKSEIITLQMAKKNEFSKAVITSQAKLLSPKHTFIAIFLLEQKTKTQSKWKPYLDILPQDHSCFPINYTKQELQMLIGSPFLFMIGEKVKDLKRDYDTVVRCDKKFEKYSFKDFCWARMIVGSRIFGLTISGVKTQVLVPFADMLNHKVPKQTMWNYVQDLHGFVIQSLQDIDLGQQVFDSYGRKCNSRFLLNYGFIIQDNQDNEIALKIKLDKDEPLSSKKLQMMKQNPQQNLNVVMKINLNMNNNKFYEFMGCLRFVVTQQMQTLKVLQRISGIQNKKQPYKWSRTPPLSIKNQVKAWYKFVQTCKQSLSGYPNAILQDRNILRKNDITQNIRNIVNIRMGQKYILNQFREIGTQIIAILQTEAMIEILEKQKDKVYYRYLYKMLCVMPGVNKQILNKKINGEEIAEIEEPEEQYLDDI